MRNPKPRQREARITLTGEGAPQIWDPWTGKISSVAQYARTADGTAMQVHLPPYGSVLVAMDGAPEALHVVRTAFPEVRDVNGRLSGIARQAGPYHAVLSNGKTVKFDVAEDEVPDVLPLGASWLLEAVGKDKNDKEYTREVHLADLKDWALMEELRNFSGKGHYTLNFQVDGHYLRPGLQLDLDLGDVRDVAEVWINEHKAATLLPAPLPLRRDPLSSRR